MGVSGGTGIIFTLMYFVLLVVFVGIQILVTIYVYKDSKKRGMEALLWALIVFFAPCYIGFIVYLIIRQKEENNKMR